MCDSVKNSVKRLIISKGRGAYWFADDFCRVAHSHQPTKRAYQFATIHKVISPFQSNHLPRFSSAPLRSCIKRYNPTALRWDFPLPIAAGNAKNYKCQKYKILKVRGGNNCRYEEVAKSTSSYLLFIGPLRGKISSPFAAYVSIFSP